MIMLAGCASSMRARCRVEKQSVAKIQLPDADAEIEPVPTTGGGRKPELHRLSDIIKAFNLEKAPRHQDTGPRSLFSP